MRNSYFLLLLSFFLVACGEDDSTSLEIQGCTDPNAANYDPSATVDDGSCFYGTNMQGCTDPEAANYNPNATVDDGSCVYTAACASPNYINFDVFSTSNDQCSSLEYIGDLTIPGRPYYVLGIENGVVIATGENTSLNLKYDFISGELTPFPSDIYNDEFKRENFYQGTRFLSMGASELRRDELLRFTDDGLKVYQVDETGENLSFYPFDITSILPPITSYQEYIGVTRILEAIKIDGYLYLFFEYRYRNTGTGAFYDLNHIIKIGDYGAGVWEYVQFGFPSFFIPSTEWITDFIVTDNGRALFLGLSGTREWDTETDAFTSAIVSAPSEYLMENVSSEDTKGLLCVEYTFADGSKEYIHYAYLRLEDEPSQFKFWYYVSSLDTWFETSEVADFGVNTVFRATSIKRTDLGANLLFNVGEDGQMWLMAPQ